MNMQTPVPFGPINDLSALAPIKRQGPKRTKEMSVRNWCSWKVTLFSLSVLILGLKCRGTILRRQRVSYTN